MKQFQPAIATLGASHGPSIPTNANANAPHIIEPTPSSLPVSLCSFVNQKPYLDHFSRGR